MDRLLTRFTERTVDRQGSRSTVPASPGDSSSSPAKPPPVDGPPSPASTSGRSPRAGEHPGGLPSPAQAPCQSARSRAAAPCRRLHTADAPPASQGGPPPHLRRLPRVRHAAGTPRTTTVPPSPSGTSLPPSLAAVLAAVPCRRLFTGVIPLSGPPGTGLRSPFRRSPAAPPSDRLGRRLGRKVL